MHLAQLLELRQVPGAGVYLTVTRRCPLSCAHCSTASMLDSEEHAADIFLNFVRTFTAADHPEIVIITGGEPMLRPDLIMQITESAHAVGTAVSVTTGLYFAREDGRIPRRLLAALLAVDHVAASQDIYHEAQVTRSAALATMETLVDAGQDVSFQVIGKGENDPYLADVTNDIRHIFKKSVPAFVGRLGSVGRAKQWLDKAPVHRDEQFVVGPCALAGWPVVAFSGTVVTCCQQNVIDGPAPAHLRLGSAPADPWPVISEQLRARAVLRAIRTFGPEVLAHEAEIPLSPTGYCDTCATLAGNERLTRIVDVLTSRQTFPFVEDKVCRIQRDGGAEAFARRYGIPGYANMVTLGYHRLASGGDGQ
jgi:pyruvate-formate lyase-activating enzyme